jgi:anthranilate phosphoribosyltransferase
MSALSPHDATALLQQLIGGSPPSNAQAYEFAAALARDLVNPFQVAAILALLAAQPDSSSTVAAFARAMREVAIPVAHPGDLLDIVGTGGDGFNTINISTAAAVLASACGATVSKHGSLSSSSLSGAADVLSALGVAMLPPTAISPCISRVGLAFMFAPAHHPGLRAAVPVRKGLRVRTILNVLGPLLNPAGARRLLLGVSRRPLLAVYAEALVDLGAAEHALIVHCCGMDELTPVGPAEVAEVRRRRETESPGPAGTGATLHSGSAQSTGGGGAYDVSFYTVDPADWGVPRCSIADLAGGSPAENAAALRAVLAGGGGGAAADAGHVGRTIALNAGAGLYVAGKAESIRQGYATALAVLETGGGLAKLDAWVAATQELAAAASSNSSGP